MLRAAKKRLLEIFQTMEQAHRELRTADDILKGMASGDTPLLLLAELQEAAFSIGSAVETSEGEGTDTVEELELYCEILWQISKQLASDVLCSRERLTELLENLHGSLKRAERSLEQIQPKYEVVFLPYQASMWDSLESVWLAAREDADCISYVVPVPYYDKLADGSFGKKHYDGNLFPDYVPITDYRAFDMETHHPDIIYFHNPYDQANFITSVHPSYYSTELKKYADVLVYIPYFVCPDNVTEHFCRLPGVLNADLVILQSEKVRETYIRCYVQELKKITGEQKIRRLAEKKFLALGSPKFDKLVQTDRERIALPKAWEKLILRSDGSRKTVLLYNTTLDGILRCNERMLEKMASVFRTLQKQNDVVLLWRPHPLLEATLSLMRPDLVKNYQRLVVQYQKSGLGIYDDTPLLHRAIAVSDACYGDGGSLAALYQAAGKPIMVQNTEVMEE